MSKSKGQIMSKPSPVARSVAHSTFDIERALPAPVERVFAAWSDAATKRRWAACHDDWRLEEHRLDFRVGGTEVNRTVEPDGTAHTMNARFLDIVPDQRIVYVYDMQVGDTRISVSLVTVVFERARTKTAKATTKMTFTEQVTFLDGHGDAEERREGTEEGFARLAADVSSP
jgi:uncharacterized protein YndB with AHSA1/START domain